MTRRVLHVIPAIAPRYGGPSQAVLGMCKALVTAGVSTLVATTDADGQGRLPVSLQRVTTYQDVPAIFFRRRLGEGFKWATGLASWLEAHVTDFDLVHVHAVFSHASIVAGRVARERGVPYVVRPLGTLDPWSVNRKRTRKQILLQTGSGQLLSGAAAIHYTAAEEQRLAEESVPGLPRGVVIPVGVGEEFLTSQRGSAAVPYVLALCRLDAKKGLDLLIRAFHDLASDTGTAVWNLMIAGAGDDRYVEMLKGLAAEGPAYSRIKFRGWVAGDDKLDLVRRASLFALPSYQENFGIAAVEAMASGVPVVVTPGVNLAGEIQAAEAGWLAERSVDGVRAALRAALTGGELEARGRAARTLAERFRWSSIAVQLAGLYEQAIASVCAA